MSRPDFVFIIGAMKAGTTTLFDHLASHPDVAPCKIKEPEFFSRQDRWERGWQWYRGLWPEDGRVRLEASVGYSRRPAGPDVPARIRQMQEEHGFTVRFLYIMRDPVERIRSHISHARAAGWDRARFADAHRSIDGDLLATSSYARQLDAYSDVFGVDRIHPVVLERLRDDPATVLRDTWRFLDLDDDVEPVVDLHRNATTELWRRGHLWRWLRRASLERRAMALPAPLRRAVRPMLGQRMQDRVDLPLALASFYAYYLARDAARLEEEFQVDTTSWTTFHEALARADPPYRAA